MSSFGIFSGADVSALVPFCPAHCYFTHCLHLHCYLRANKWWWWWWWWCQCCSCVATILSDVKCTSVWVLNATFAYGGTAHLTVSTLAECQAACEFEPRCIAVDWKARDHKCLLFTNSNHTHHHVSNPLWKHYELVNRCNITLGQCFGSTIISNIFSCFFILFHFLCIFS